MTETKKEIVVKETVFVAEDGTEFTTKENCIWYEQNKHFEKIEQKIKGTKIWFVVDTKYANKLNEGRILGVYSSVKKAQKVVSILKMTFQDKDECRFVITFSSLDDKIIDFSVSELKEKIKDYEINGVL